MEDLLVRVLENDLLCIESLNELYKKSVKEYRSFFQLIFSHYLLKIYDMDCPLLITYFQQCSHQRFLYQTLFDVFSRQGEKNPRFVTIVASCTVVGRNELRTHLSEMKKVDDFLILILQDVSEYCWNVQDKMDLMMTHAGLEKKATVRIVALKALIGLACEMNATEKRSLVLFLKDALRDKAIKVRTVAIKGLCTFTAQEIVILLRDTIKMTELTAEMFLVYETLPEQHEVQEVVQEFVLSYLCLPKTLEERCAAASELILMGINPDLFQRIYETKIHDIFD